MLKKLIGRVLTALGRTDTLRWIMRREWVRELRSGKLQQVKGHLRKAFNPMEDASEYCCLGVACEVAARYGIIPVPQRTNLASRIFAYGPLYTQTAGMPSDVIDAFGLRGSMASPDNYEGKSLATHNDDGATFADIADLIEGGGFYANVGPV